MEDTVPNFWIGHHEDIRVKCASAELTKQAHISGYDMVTSPITTDFFHSRVLALLSSTQFNATPSDGDTKPPASESPFSLTVPALSAFDTQLIPDESLSQIIAVTSSWIDLCSPDPLVANVSKQVLMLEIAYAAFCGITYVLIPGPRLHHQTVQPTGLIQYARAVQEALAVGTYMQVKIWLPMIDHHENEFARMGDLAPFARPGFLCGDHGDDVSGLDLYGTWDAWNVIRSFCRYHTRLCLALKLPKHLPPVDIQSRWYSEPVRLLTIDKASFTKNVKGYPVLPKPHQTLIHRYMQLRLPPWILLCHVGPTPNGVDVSAGSNPCRNIGPNSSLADASAGFPTLAEAVKDSRRPGDDPTPHLSYMRALQNKQPCQSRVERFSNGYQDYLQAPLQPLTVNLESITYEVFEKDPVKYDWYERAIARALRDWTEQGKPTSGPNGRVVVAVVGAGRGPLVTRALRASDEVRVEIDIWALEKNPNAFVLLQQHNANPEMWANRVKLVKSDMRTWKGPWRARETSPPHAIGQAVIPGLPSSSVSTNPLVPEAAAGAMDIDYCNIDILISELLGSFADNELSPECLDGVQHLLNPVHGMSIPASYTAHVTPIAAPKLHADISAQSLSNPNATETPYVVMLHAIDYLSTISSSPSTQEASTHPTDPVIQKAWSFAHPNHHLSQPANNSVGLTPVTAVTNAHNARHTTLSFPIPQRGTLHGLAGYFEAVLYGNVELSTNPLTMGQKSEGMISWFPIYFPLKTPIYLPSDAELVLNMWRQTDDRKVWYEWIVEVFAPLHDEPVLGVSTGTAAGGVHQGKGKGKDGKETDERAGMDPGTMPSRSRKKKKRMRIAVSELHSSVKEACLM